jgi:hypothetical protein
LDEHPSPTPDELGIEIDQAANRAAMRIYRDRGRNDFADDPEFAPDPSRLLTKIVDSSHMVPDDLLEQHEDIEFVISLIDPTLKRIRSANPIRYGQLEELFFSRASGELSFSDDVADEALRCFRDSLANLCDERAAGHTGERRESLNALSAFLHRRVKGSAARTEFLHDLLAAFDVDLYLASPFAALARRRDEKRRFVREN